MRAATTPIAALSLIACTTASQTSDQPADRCPTTSCFSLQQVRNFEVIDATTLVLYVGNQDCPFLVELNGPSCDVTYVGSTTLTFRHDSLHEDFQSDLRLTRVCARDIDIGIEDDPFTDDDIDTPGNTLACHIRNVASLTDDELLELYVDRNLAPPPAPLGKGQVTVPDDEPSEAAGASATTGEGSAEPSPTDAPNE
jgi:hypothetical protein